jgi:predicted alpha/beta-fold hydrolase
MKKSRFALLIPILIVALSANVAQAEGETVELVSAQNAATSTLPPYTFACDDGVYATLYGYLSVKHVAVPQQRLEYLTVPGFARPVPIYVVTQSQPAPLVIVMLGISGQASTDFSKQWPCWLARAGFNVLTFDSTFRPEFLDIGGSHVGVSGNIWAESAKVRDLIDAFLASHSSQMQQTKLGLVGMSYGGVQALILGQMATEGKLPFKVDAIQAYSPPIDMRQTAGILDDWYNEYRWKYTMIEMYTTVASHKPHCGYGCALLPDDLTHAAIATSFQLGLKEALLANNRRFCLHLFSSDPVQRDGELGQWGFTRYAYELALPWWREHMGSDNKIDELTDATRLPTLMRHQPPCTEAILSSDDPFNAPQDIAEVRDQAKELSVTILPRGGHLGYIADPWTRAKLLTLFDCAAKPAAPATPPVQAR